MGEMLEQLDLKESQLTFTPHLLPIPRGILSTTYVTFRERKDTAEVDELFREFYASKLKEKNIEVDKNPRSVFVFVHPHVRRSHGFSAGEWGHHG